jgi:SAM-dependent methyltransferase
MEIELGRENNDVPRTEAHGLTSKADRMYWSAFAEIVTQHPHSLEHFLALWPAYTKRISLVRFLSHYKLFMKTENLPGDILDLGVSRGVSFFTFHKLLEIVLPTDTSKKVIGIDSFEGLEDFSEKDGAEDVSVGKTVGGWSASSVEDEVFKLLELHNLDGILTKQRGMLLKGRVQEQIPRLLLDRPGMRISLLHLDLDLYEPTLFSLETLWDLVVPGGLVVFDEYALPPWEGETKAWEDFAKARGITGLRIIKDPGSLNPNGYLIKP